MILTVDVGNTNILLGGFREDRLCVVARLATDPTLTEDEYAVKLLEILSLHGVTRKEIDGAILSSVVPALHTVLCRAIAFLYGITPLTVGPGIKTGLNIHCDLPSSVGADIICDCVGANRLYGAPALVIDLGTATKMMVLNEKGTFIGLSIIPGVRMGLRALSQETAQLPQVSLEAPPTVVAKNTADCMRSGVIYGHASMLDGMIDRIREEVGTDLPVYATGGLAPLIVSHCRHSVILSEHLVLHGLYRIYEKNK